MSPLHCTLLLVAIGVILPISGCSKPLETTYATARGESINGISTFIELLKNSNHSVDLWPGISPQMQWKYETLIVFHASFGEVPEKVLRDTRDLMLIGDIETLIFVVRDSDMAVDYWRQISDQKERSASEVEDALTSYRQLRADFGMKVKNEFSKKADNWYGLKRTDRTSDLFEKPIHCETFEGPVTVTARWSLNRRLETSEAATTIWSSGDDPLLTMEDTEFGTIFVVGSATPFLNGGLVDPGNRQLTSEFLQLIPSSDRVALATSSNWVDLSRPEAPSLLTFMKVHPNGWVFGQGIAALLMFCWWKYPIFGRPKQTVSMESARFGRHVEALGKLLWRTRDVDYARGRIREWHASQKSPSNRDGN